MGNDDRVDNIDTLTCVFGKCTAEGVAGLALDLARDELVTKTTAATVPATPRPSMLPLAISSRTLNSGYCRRQRSR